MREGWGIRDRRIGSLLEDHEPAARDEMRWGDGSPMRVDAHFGVVALPDDLVTSVRCIVRVDDAIVVCTNRHGSHPWPGGRREPGETFEQTACREVHEETGWILDPSSLRQLGWLRCEFQDRKPDDWPYPNPDFLQVVFTGRAIRRDDAQGGSWTDTEGYEEESRLVSPTDPDLVFERDEIARVYLDALDEDPRREGRRRGAERP